MEVTIDNLDDMCSLMCDNVVPQKGERTMRYEDYKVEDMVFTNKEDWTEEEKREFLDTCPEGKGTPEKIEALYSLLDAIDNGEIKINQYREINKNSGAAYGKRNGNIIHLSTMRYSTHKTLCINADGEEKEINSVWRIETLIKDLQDINHRFNRIAMIYENREAQYKKKHEEEMYEETNRERIIANRIAYIWLDSLRLEIPTEVKERDYWRSEQGIPQFEANTKNFRGYDFISRSNYGELKFYNKVVSKEDAEYISKVIERATWDLLPVMNKCRAAIEDLKEKYKDKED